MARVREAGLGERILDTAFNVFGERGFQAATMREIAAGAGISPGSIYTYYPDKESLFKATVTRTWESFIHELEGLRGEDLSRAERIAALYERGFAALSSAVPLVKGMFVMAAKLDLVEPYLERVCGTIDRIIEPEADAEDQEEWDRTQPRRLATTRMLVLGILASAALLPEGGAGENLEGLREAGMALLSEASFMREAGVLPLEG